MTDAEARGRCTRPNTTTSATTAIAIAVNAPNLIRRRMRRARSSLRSFPRFSPTMTRYVLARIAASVHAAMRMSSFTARTRGPRSLNGLTPLADGKAPDVSAGRIPRALGLFAPTRWINWRVAEAGAGADEVTSERKKRRGAGPPAHPRQFQHRGRRRALANKKCGKGKQTTPGVLADPGAPQA